MEEVLDKVKGLSTIQEAITYFERVHDAIEMNEKPTLPDFYIVRSNSNGNPTIELNLKPLNEETYNFVITGSRKHINKLLRWILFVQAGSGNRSDSLNLVLKEIFHKELVLARQFRSLLKK